jgi:hypothetical protein
MVARDLEPAYGTRVRARGVSMQYHFTLRDVASTLKWHCLRTAERMAVDGSAMKRWRCRVLVSAGDLILAMRHGPAWSVNSRRFKLRATTPQAPFSHPQPELLGRPDLSRFESCDGINSSRAGVESAVCTRHCDGCWPGCTESPGCICDDMQLASCLVVRHLKQQITRPGHSA